MNDSSGVAVSFEQVANELRVPDLKYQLEDDPVDEAQLGVCMDHFLSSPDNHENASAVAELRQCSAKASLPVYFNNCAFMADRIFDVWLRKNQQEKEVNDKLSRWRFVFTAMLWNRHAKIDKEITMFIQFVDLLSEWTIGWNPRPERNKKLLLDKLLETEAMLFSRLVLEENYLQEIIKQWEDFLGKQAEKTQKLNERLILAEEKGSVARVSERQAKYHLNEMFVGKNLSTALISFLCEYWQRALMIGLQQPDDEALQKQLKLLTWSMVDVFHGKGDAVFNKSEQLIDELISMMDKLKVDVPPSAWQAMQQDLICMMQGQFFSEAEFQPIPVDHPLPSSSFVPPEVNAWLKLNRGEDWDRVQLLQHFVPGSEFLFVNYLGMKIALFHQEDLELLVKQKMLLSIPVAPTFEAVLQSAISGLSKVSAAQKQERLKAAAKARQEAQAVEEAKKVAEEKAKSQAEEISKRAAALKSRMEEKKRLNEERNVLEGIQAMKLGAWISIVDGENKKRYKLIVKLSATQKYIFVDKLGVSKKEYVEQDLLQEVLAEKIAILSDGAEFEDSLERVVSRMRISR